MLEFRVFAALPQPGQTVPSKAAASEMLRRTAEYVEALSDARTKLEDCFTRLICRSGEIGRRKGLKIPRAHKAHAGSIPASGTTHAQTLFQLLMVLMAVGNSAVIPKGSQ